MNRHLRYTAYEPWAMDYILQAVEAIDPLIKRGGPKAPGRQNGPPRPKTSVLARKANYCRICPGAMSGQKMWIWPKGHRTPKWTNCS
ncbi:hypothetical protein O181_108535 [Austropuccinia psidii MF-1]|uniref:Uncharacterized protein n=1 Tax=Austropuccinia psidii MF-1 TaxID=1389203 RepID=A0A9Q3PPN9_9BASI|nr:hypothetical protein [Austropuccinia psidii MF-1]